MGLEYKIENSTRKLLDKVSCDRCGIQIEKVTSGGWNQFGEPYSLYHEPSFGEFFLLKHQWGYGSPRDGEVHEAVICEPCYNIVFQGVKITVTHDWRFDGLENFNESELDTSTNSNSEGS